MGGGSATIFNGGQFADKAYVNGAAIPLDDGLTNPTLTTVTLHGNDPTTNPGGDTLFFDPGVHYGPNVDTYGGNPIPPNPPNPGTLYTLNKRKRNAGLWNRKLYPDSARIRRPPLPNGAIRILPNG